MIPRNRINYDSFTEGDVTFSLETGEKLYGINALKQNIEVMLSTARYQHPIYSWNFGFEREYLIGKSKPFVEVELERLITETLKEDDRILGITDFKTEFAGSRCTAFFIVNTVYGDIGRSLDV